MKLSETRLALLEDLLGEQGESKEECLPERFFEYALA
jgi:hypothetical protein